MNKMIKSAIALSAAAISLILPAIPANAAIQSKSKELVVMTPQDLPEWAQIEGDSLLLHSDNAGGTYLYVEQQEGKRLSIFDVTDPARIKLTVSTEMPDEGPFQFIRPLNDDAELVYFLEGKKVGVLNLRKIKKPELHVLSISANLITAEELGQSGLLAADAASSYAPAASRDFQVIDVSSADPTPLAVVKNVQDRVTNSETGTMFLLGVDGLTVVRRLSVETEHEIHEMQMHGN